MTNKIASFEIAGRFPEKNRKTVETFNNDRELINKQQKKKIQMLKILMFYRKSSLK